MASKKSNEDAFGRMNFLYQAASMCLKTPTEQSVRMAAYYGMLLRSVGKKAQARMDPSMKRTLCKGCHTVLIPGVTAMVRLQKRPAARITWLCKCCSTIKRFNLRKDYKIWVEREEAVVGHNNNNSKPANVRTDRNAAGTSANKLENKSNRGKQNKTTGGVTVNKADLVSTSVVPAVKPDGNVSAVLCDAISSDEINPFNFSIKQCGVNNAGKLNDSVSHITLSDVDPSDKINSTRSDSKQCDVDSAVELEVSVSDIRLCETNPSNNINLPTSDIKQYHIDPINKISDVKLSDIDPSDKINTSNSNSKLYNIDTMDQLVKVCDVEPSVKVNLHSSDVKQSSSNLAESVSDMKLCDVDPSNNINDNDNGIRLRKNSETDVIMDVDNSNIVEDAH